VRRLKSAGVFSIGLWGSRSGGGDNVAIIILHRLGFAPFQVGELVLARGLEHAVAGVPVSRQGDLVEKSNAANPTSAGCCWALKNRLSSASRGGRSRVARKLGVWMVK